MKQKEREIPVFTFGTYFTSKCQEPGANAWPMKKLIWWAKADPSKVISEQWINHPAHSGTALCLNSPGVAYNYVARLIQENLEGIREQLSLGDAKLSFVPVPSSEVTKATVMTARWSGREIATRLVALGLGQLGPLVVNKSPMPRKTQGGRPTFSELRANLELGRGFLWGGRTFVYIDDVVTDGDHIAALDDFCGKRPGASAICIGCTDKHPYDAYDCRLRKIVVDHAPFMGTGTEVSIFDV